MWWLLILGCPHAPTEDPGASAQASPAEQQYASCRARVEGREAEAECAQESDCVAAGCSKEVCLPVSLAEGFMSTCDRLDCFAVLDTCGCHAGRCTWSLKEG